VTAPLPAHVAAWIEQAVPVMEHLPCGHYLGDQGHPCGDTPTRAYIGGRRCITHAPDQQHTTKES